MGLWLEQLRDAARAHGSGHWAALQVLAVLSALGWFVARTPGERRKLRVCLLAAFAGAGLGSVALGLLLRLPAWAVSGFRLRLFSGGEIMAYGALGGLVLTYAALARMRGFSPHAALDLVAPSLGVMVFFARIGCFVAGCDFGTVTLLPWAVRYPAETAAFRHHLDAGLILPGATASLPVHPAQLYEAAVGLCMVAVALWAERRARASDGRQAAGNVTAGSVFAATAITYAVGRFVVELFRGDVRGALGPLSTPQWLSIVAVALVMLRPEPKSSPAHAAT